MCLCRTACLCVVARLSVGGPGGEGTPRRDREACASRSLRVPRGPYVCLAVPTVPRGPYVCLAVPMCASRSLRVPRGPYVCLAVPTCASRSLRVPRGPACVQPFKNLSVHLTPGLYCVRNSGHILLTSYLHLNYILPLKLF